MITTEVVKEQGTEKTNVNADAEPLDVTFSKLEQQRLSGELSGRELARFFRRLTETDTQTWLPKAIELIGSANFKTLREYQDILFDLGKWNQIDVAHQLLTRLLGPAGTTPLASTFHPFLRHYCRAPGHLDKLKMYWALLTKHTEPDARAYGHYQTGLLVNDAAEDIADLMKEMKARQIEPQANIVSTAILRLARKKPTKALEIWNEVKDSSIQLSFPAYMSLMRVFQTRKDFENTVKIFESAKQQGYTPDGSMLRSVLSAASKPEHKTRALVIFNEWQKIDNFKWDANLFATLCNFSQRMEDIKPAIWGWGHCKRSNIPITLSAYYVLMRALKRSRLVVSVYDEMKSNGITPSHECTILYLKVLAWTDPAKAWEIYKQDPKAYPTHIGSAIVEGFAKKNELDQVPDVIKSIEQAVDYKNNFSLGGLMRAYHAARRVDDAIAALSRPDAIKSRDTVSALVSIITESEEDRQLARAAGLANERLRTSVLIRLLDRAVALKKKEKAVELRDRITASGGAIPEGLLKGLDALP